MASILSYLFVLLVLGQLVSGSRKILRRKRAKRPYSTTRLGSSRFRSTSAPASSEQEILEPFNTLSTEESGEGMSLTDSQAEAPTRTQSHDEYSTWFTKELLLPESPHDDGRSSVYGSETRGPEVTISSTSSSLSDPLDCLLPDPVGFQNSETYPSRFEMTTISGIGLSPRTVASIATTPTSSPDSSPSSSPVKAHKSSPDISPGSSPSTLDLPYGLSAMSLLSFGEMLGSKSVQEEQVPVAPKSKRLVKLKKRLPPIRIASPETETVEFTTPKKHKRTVTFNPELTIHCISPAPLIEGESSNFWPRRNKKSGREPCGVFDDGDISDDIDDEDEDDDQTTGAV